LDTAPIAAVAVDRLAAGDRASTPGRGGRRFAEDSSHAAGCTSAHGCASRRNEPEALGIAPTFVAGSGLMELDVRPAGMADVPALVGLMQAFYAEAGIPLAAGPAERAFAALLAAPHLGAVWLAVRSGEAVGHVVLTVAFSMEYGGPRGFIDDLYVRPSERGRGAGAALLAAARTGALERGLRALCVETGPADHPARGLYARAGFVDSGHALLVQPLAAPVHAE
jgi:GNAT superfamily N-acetyltransferase